MMGGACHRGENRMALNEGEFGEGAEVRTEKGQGQGYDHPQSNNATSGTLKLLSSSFFMRK